MTRTKIEWADETINPTTGCTEYGMDCANCYARRMSQRLKAMGAPKYRDGFEPRFHQSTLKPIRGNSKLIFVNSMSDLFHKEFSLEIINEVLKWIREQPKHRFIVLTKRAERLTEIDDQVAWPENLILGVSIGMNRYVYRADLIRKCGARTKLVSAEPLLEDLPDLDLRGIHWLISGGESGPGHRPFNPQWAINLKDRCKRDAIAFFHKQNGGLRPKSNGRMLNGREYTEYPVVPGEKECI